MNIADFYEAGKQSSLSYLEFGAINLIEGTKTVWDFRINQTAYDWLMLARYANDMSAYLEMIDVIKVDSIHAAVEIYRREIHHRADFSVNLGKLIALSVASAKNTGPSFFELGQTLFGCIEGMEFCSTLLQKIDSTSRISDLKNVAWYGIDISKLFNRLAVCMHSGYSISVSNDITTIPARTSLFFAKGVTLLYAIRSIDALFELLNRSDAALFDYSLSVNSSQEVIIGTGKTVMYLPFDDFMTAYSKGNNKIHVKKGNSHYNKETGRVFIDAIWGSQSFCNDYIVQDGRIRESIRAGIDPKTDADLLLDNTNGRNGGWITLEEFIETHIPSKVSVL